MDIYNASTVDEGEEPPIELSLEDYEDAKKSLLTIIERGEAALRLAKNPDFKELVMDGYLTDEPKRLAELMASGRLHQSTMDDCTKQLDAIGKFRNFMKLMTEQSATSRDELVDLEQARDDAIAAEVEAQG